MSIVIKPDRDIDMYVVWSNIVEAPLWWGPRADAVRYLEEDRARRGNADHPADVCLDRADEHGTSDMSIRDGGWDDHGFIYEQRGWLPRARLIDACRLLAVGNEAAVWDLLEPFDDERPVRRG